MPLSSDQAAASTHVNKCLGEEGDASGGEEEEYEEYTWCGVTHVRATSMMSVQARASKTHPAT